MTAEGKTLKDLFLEIAGEGESVDLGNGVILKMVAGTLCVGERWIDGLPAEEVESLSLALREKAGENPYLDPANAPKDLSGE